MKTAIGFYVVSVGVAFATACGGNSTTVATGTDGGSSSGSASGSGNNGSGVGTGGSGASGGSTSGAGASGADNTAGDGGPMTAVGDCPSCPGNQVCCLAQSGGQVLGTCAVNAAACPGGASPLPCAAAGDCNGGLMCCVTVGNANTPSSTQCAASCPTGSPPACGGSPSDNSDCPGGGAGWTCETVAGTPSAVLGICVAAPIPDAGSGTVDSGPATVDAGSGAVDAAPASEAGPVQDAASGG